MCTQTHPVWSFLSASMTPNMCVAAADAYRQRSLLYLKPAVFLPNVDEYRWKIRICSVWDLYENNNNNKVQVYALSVCASSQFKTDLAFKHAW